MNLEVIETNTNFSIYILIDILAYDKVTNPEASNRKCTQ